MTEPKPSRTARFCGKAYRLYDLTLRSGVYYAAGAWTEVGESASLAVRGFIGNPLFEGSGEEVPLPALLLVMLLAWLMIVLMLVALFATSPFWATCSIIQAARLRRRYLRKQSVAD